MDIAMLAPVMPDYFERFQAHILQEFAEGAAAWSQSVSALSRWEDEHLLDEPNAAALAAHRQMADRLLKFGEFLALTTEGPDFFDRELKENVATTLQTLRDKIPLWHSQMSAERRDAILHGE